MEFTFTQEQKMIRDTAQAFLAEISSSQAIRSAMATEQGYEDKIWQRICDEMYWQAIHVPEEYGGLGLGYVELVVLLEQMGRYLLCSPFFSTVCLGANALMIAGTEAQKQQYLSQICAGSLTATLAYTGSNGRWGSDAIEGVIDLQGENYVLNGTYRYVPDGHTADLLIVAARHKGSKGEAGISLFAICANTPGVSRTWLPTMDQTRKQAEIIFENVTLSKDHLMAEPANAWLPLQQILHLATIATAAEQTGGSQQVLDLTVAYTKERVQFGRPVAGFQAVKHLAADMMLRTEVARSAIYYAGCVAEESINGGSLALELAEAASVAKAYCSDGYFKNASDAIQLHGGVGFTWEYDVHLYFKRAKSSELFLGNGAYHREQVAKILLD
ncbi:acyl-CoA dehydrogenase family protein [Colwellia sp. PAMC 21821]|uniref:acyl-CoA dehydrogenase family protein n=1 Tax=Colwellia sp. PAMC 21821 TaxID=1816219 RepID=UPI0009C17D10|nr:acyl-CoA dehydrogenase family protein [Colwellia sp. PAMC 21821]ARD46107.1 acyl-CoA dehydrogenase [Colwellia sp. PAMC 21821]